MNQAFIQPSPTKRAQFIAPVLIYAGGKAHFFSRDGEISILTKTAIDLFAVKDPILVCHAPYTAARTGVKIEHALDILELFAFVHPTKFCVPTPAGVMKAMGQIVPTDPDDILTSLLESVDHLLNDLHAQTKDHKRILDLASAMGLQGRGWLWTSIIFAAFGQPYDYTIPIEARLSFNVWNHLPEWSEGPQTDLTTHNAITGDETRARLSQILGQSATSEQRADQVNYATRITDAFQAKQTIDSQHVILAEAGTGVGKTLGYLTPTSVWTEKNNSPVWISTYTKNLQRQIDTELDKIYPDPVVKDAKVTVRKGRENYLCLLNFQDQALSSPVMQSAKPAIASGIMARWISQTKDGDLSGADFPGWLSNLLGAQNTLLLADKRGECIYAACDHYQKCFAERVVRKSASTPIVIANHATVMIQTAMVGESDVIPNRYIFDEGHHLFHAADNVFCTHITGQGGYELRRWLMGPEGGRKSRARGLKKRIDNVLPEQTQIQDMLFNIMRSAQTLPPEHWLKNINDTGSKLNFETMISALRTQILSRDDGVKTAYSLETILYPLSDELRASLAPAISDLKNLKNNLQKLVNYLRRILVDDMDKYSSDQRKRIDILAISLDKKIKFDLSGWIDTLTSLTESETNIDFVDWGGIEKIDGKIYDIGLYRHTINPMKNFATALKPNLHSAVITSATLRDQSDLNDDLISWQSAINLTGTNFLTDTPQHFSIPSPFSYKDQTKIIIIDDIPKDDVDQLAAAYQNLFTASGGGALGLFTSIQRLKSVHSRIETALSSNDITLYSQHIDGIDTGTLIDMFRDDTHSCLLGTDAVRDGVDIPGESLRLIVFDRVPWARPTILHKARRSVFGKRHYDEALTRLKLKQAYGRLIRQAHDRGVFIMLDSSTPTKLLSAFPDTVLIERVGIKDAIDITKHFLKS